MESSEKGLRHKLGAIRETYLLKLGDRMRESEEKWNAILETPSDAEGFIEFHRMVHTLAGSSAVFGLRLLSEKAKTLETLIKSVMDEKSFEREDIRKSISEHMVALRRLCSGEAEREVPEPEVPAQAASQASILAEEREKKLIYLVEDDPMQLENLVVQISHFGYTVKSFSTLEEAKKAIGKAVPSVIIMDIMFPEGGLAGIETISELRREHGKELPVIFISNRNDIEARLRVVRAGGNAYFMKPIKVIEIIEKLDSLTMPEEPERYRILIVDDDPDLASYYASILEDAGMVTRTLSNPLQALDHLIEFKPDLILTDMYMPGCSGPELASVIRQIHAYVSIPIVFLSMETDVDRHLTAMRVGGDDFLTKPIQPRHLISSISTRAERMRIMRSLMERDGLTGLLNHTHILGQLDLAIKRASRQQSRFAFAMIDIDNFKSVNDTYGHSTGDRVLNSLARLLQQRLRKTDLVGRYGGEEFALLLLDTDLEAATRVLDEIRESFSKIVHMYEDKTFSVTFSGGLSGFPHFRDVPGLIDAADAALYNSKSEGKNRVTVAHRQNSKNMKCYCFDSE